MKVKRKLLAKLPILNSSPWDTDQLLNIFSSAAKRAKQEIGGLRIEVHGASTLHSKADVEYMRLWIPKDADRQGIEYVFLHELHHAKQLAQGKDSIVREAEASLFSLKYSVVSLEYRPSVIFKMLELDPNLGADAGRSVLNYIGRPGYRPSLGVVKLASTLGVTKIGDWELKDSDWFNQAGEILELDKQETPRDTAIETRLTVVQFWIVYLLVWEHYQSLLKQGIEDDEWLEVLLCLQRAYKVYEEGGHTKPLIQQKLTKLPPYSLI